MKLNQIRRIAEEIHAFNEILYGTDGTRWPQNVMKAEALIDVLVGIVSEQEMLATHWSNPTTREHLAVFGDRGWSLHHPADCPVTEWRSSCPINDAIHIASTDAGPPVAAGIYQVWLDHNDELQFESVASGAES